MEGQIECYEHSISIPVPMMAINPNEIHAFFGMGCWGASIEKAQKREGGGGGV